MLKQESLEHDEPSPEEISQQRIDELLAAVARHPAAAAEVLKAADSLLADKQAYLELDFDEASELAAQEEIKPAERLQQANSDTERGRIISANILGRASIYAARLAELDKTKAQTTDLAQSA